MSGKYHQKCPGTIGKYPVFDWILHDLGQKSMSGIFNCLKFVLKLVSGIFDCTEFVLESVSGIFECPKFISKFDVRNLIVLKLSSIHFQ